MLLGILYVDSDGTEHVNDAESAFCQYRFSIEAWAEDIRNGEGAWDAEDGEVDERPV